MTKTASLFASTMCALAVCAVQAAPVTYHAYLTGAAENPSNASPGLGEAWVVLDVVAHTLRIDASFSGLLGRTRAAHIHCCIAAPGNVGVATETPSFGNLPLGVTAGAFIENYDLTLASSWNPTYIANNGGTTASAEAAFAAGMAAGRSYLNIHTTLFPGGEIRGFLTVSEPATAALLALSLVALGWSTRLRSSPA